ncbi:ricin-type beta-trefoil lectin domain protein, partial [Hydrogenophaga sp. 5NK40-0174]|uniref:ricin-type beta-trefoil lectin domain protein n=1 Tax=Hydrogenophaga sp. 5NK40-0174 TaxID=3127649 RepID=UPI003341606E
DFNIERPSPARDIPVKDTVLATVNNHFTRVEPDGSFEFKDVRAKVASHVDGDNVALLSEPVVTVKARFRNYMNEDEKVGPRKADLNVFGSLNGKLKLDATALLDVQRFPGGLRLQSARNCMTTDLPTTSTPSPSPRLASCGYQQLQHEWQFDQVISSNNKAVSATYQISRQPFDQCLSAPFVFGSTSAALLPVKLARCSTSRYQQWTFRSDGTLRNPATGMCLSARPDPKRIGDKS